MGWNEIKNQKSGDSGDKKDIKWANLQQGTHQFRILDEEPYSRWTHWIQSANSGKGSTVECIGKDCPVCEAIKAAKAQKLTPKFNSRKQHAVNALQRKTGSDGKPVPGDIGELVIIDKGNALFESLAGIYEEVGDLRGYDIKIRVTGAGKDTSYTPIPLAPKALTADEQAIEKYDFDKTFTKLNRDQVIMLMNGGSYKDIFDTDTETADDGEPPFNVDFTK